MPDSLPWHILHENLPVIEMLKQNFSSYWVPSENRLKPSEFNEILAWADYCVAVCAGPETFEKSIVAHLSHSCQKDFTFKQINAKVEEFWKRNKRPNDSVHTIVYRIGTKALQGKEFSDERAQFVRKRVRHLQKQPVPEYAEPSSRSTRKKRKVEHISTRDEVPKRFVKQIDDSHLSPSTRSMTRRSPRYSISVQVRYYNGIICIVVPGKTNTESSRSHKCGAEKPSVSMYSKILELNLWSSNVSTMISHTYPLFRQLETKLKTPSPRLRADAKGAQRCSSLLQEE